MRVQQIYTASKLRNFTYLITAGEDLTICIDPFDAGQIQRELKAQGRRLTHIINTHEHWDHVEGNPELVRVYQPEVLAHPDCGAPGQTGSLEAGQRIDLEPGSYLEVLETPGHTAVHVCLLLVEAGRPEAIFSGDTLFNAGVGHCKRGGDPDTLYNTISGQFHPLADDIKVYPGHEYMGNNLRFTLEYEAGNEAARRLLERYETETRGGQYIVSTIGLEREVNTFFRLRSPELRETLSGHFSEVNQSSDDRTVFLKLRKLRDDW